MQSFQKTSAAGAALLYIEILGKLTEVGGRGTRPEFEGLFSFIVEEEL